MNESEQRKHLAKAKFKAKMNGIKLTKRIDLGQAKAMVWMLENYPDDMECIYTKAKPFNQSQFDQFWDRLPPEMKKKKKDAIRHWTNLNPDDKLFKIILDALEAQKIEMSRRAKAGKFCPEWPSAASWIYKRRWEDHVNLTPEIEKNASTQYTACARTAKILAEREEARSNRVVDINKALSPELRRKLLKPSSV